MDTAPDSSRLSRKELQTYLKAWSCKATGTTEALREAYENATLQNLGRTPTTNSTPCSDRGAASSNPSSDVCTATKSELDSEIRLKSYRSTPSLAIRQRIDRARTQRLYLVQRSVSVETKTCKFVVLGSTGNIYDVDIAQIPHCSCPDHAKGNLCKHILFVMLKVIGLPPDSPLVYQDAYLQSELDDLIEFLNRRRVGGSVMANTNVQTMYASLQKGDCQKGDDVADPKRKSLLEDSDCPICFDAMDAASASSLTYCRAACGSNFHVECIRRWLGQNQHNPTCPNCRQGWQGCRDGTEPTKEGYTNLGALQGQSDDRDSSTYSPWYNSSYKRQRRW